VVFFFLYRRHRKHHQAKRVQYDTSEVFEIDETTPAIHPFSGPYSERSPRNSLHQSSSDSYTTLFEPPVSDAKPRLGEMGQILPMPAYAQSVTYAAHPPR
jgi:hypothetical protein